MNKFLQGFLNIPNGKIVDIFKLDYISMPDKYNSKDIIKLVKQVYDIDVNLIVSNTISKINVGIGSDSHNLAEYFEDMGALWIIEEKRLTPKELANQIIDCINTKDRLKLAAINMLKLRRPNANNELKSYILSKI